MKRRKDSKIKGSELELCGQLRAYYYENDTMHKFSEEGMKNLKEFLQWVASSFGFLPKNIKVNILTQPPIGIDFSNDNIMDELWSAINGKRYREFEIAVLEGEYDRYLDRLENQAKK